MPMPSFTERARAACSHLSGTIPLDGLARPVEVLRDRWGIPHIYAETMDDLFFAQGFVASQDRMWQMEMWRRAGEGRLAEVLGPEALERDVFARRLRYRGDAAAEWRSYAPDARRIVEAFVRGVNAYIESTCDNPPIEFQVMGFAPERWTPEVCLSRTAGYAMTRNVVHETVRALLVREYGPETAARLMPTEPPVHIDLPEGLDLEDVTLDVLSGHIAASAPLVRAAEAGSNNWVVDGSKSVTGKPLLANDPHRAIALPSLRYTTHLVGPGWNVIGAGEPALPGVALGHNERVAFGFTIFMTDDQDLYVEETHPGNPRLYRYKDAWEEMETETQAFRVKGEAEPVEVELRFTRHGPVIHQDAKRCRAYALRWTGSEPGTAGYLASLSLDRASDWETFLSALERWKLPSENLVYADVDGNIGYQVAGLVPERRNWTGLVPAPGRAGRYEWTGFLPLSSLPRAYNPPCGYVVTANHRTLAPDDTRHIGYEWAPPFRFRRIDEALRADRRFSVEDFQRLQADVLSLPARALIPLLDRSRMATKALEGAVELLQAWDGRVSKESPAAALYETWYVELVERVIRPRIPDDLWSVYREIYSIEALLGLARDPDDGFGPDPAAGRDAVLADSLAAAFDGLSARFGAEVGRWRWGALHTVTFAHPLADGVRTPEWSRGPVPRGGDGHTVNYTADPFRSDFAQTGGASYRQILDVSNWDASVVVNAPGQSGQPGSPHYDDLIPLWASDDYHPLPYSRAAVEAATTSRLILSPVA